LRRIHRDACAPLTSRLLLVPRSPRLLFANQYYHLLNRANRGSVVFHEPGDYHAFLALINRAQQQVEVPIVAACLMPNHVHLVVHPRGAADLPLWTRWLFTTHVRHYHQKYGTIGRLWQGRYKAFLTQDDHYLLTLIRYVERNALRKNLVDRAEDWRWGSLRWRAMDRAPLSLEPPPLALPGNWAEYVNLPQTSAEVEAIRASVNRQRPYGDPEWVKEKARDAGLDQSLVTPGRPRKRRCGPVC
jgi:putative transposase